MEYCEGGSLEVLYKKVKANGWRTGEKVLGKIAESVSSFPCSWRVFSSFYHLTLHNATVGAKWFSLFT